MKKNFTIALAAIVALSSCTALEDDMMPVLPQVENHEIAFRASAEQNTRLGSAENTMKISDMNVAAYNVSESSDYFTATSFNKGANVYAGGKYWPQNVSYINFLAYSGSEPAQFGNANSDFAGQFSVVVPASNKDSQEDFLYAIGHGEVTKSGSSLSFPTEVDMVFKQTQATVNFTAVAEGEAQIELESITLTGASFGGTLTVSQSNFQSRSSQSAKAVWSNITAAESAQIPGWKAGALSSEKVSVGRGLKVIPQTMAASGFKVIYSVNGKQNYFTYFFSADEKNFEAGQSYTFNLTIGQNGVSVSNN